MKNNKTQEGLQKITTIILTVIIASVAIIGASYALKGYMNKISMLDEEKEAEVKTEEPSEADKIIGGEKDEHGCMLMAGYTWCEDKQKCLREWEEPCEQEQAFNLLSELKTSTKISFSGINKRELTWQTEEGELKASGRGFDATDITDEQYRSIRSFLEDQGFKADFYNVSAGTIAESAGYAKDDMYCTITGGVKGYKEATGEWIPSEPDLSAQAGKKEVEVICATLEIDELAGWQTFENEKYAYSLKYPKDCLNGPLPGYCKQSPPEERPRECLCYFNAENPDSVSLGIFTGTKSDLTGAFFDVFHSIYVDYYSPPAGTGLVSWVKENFSYYDDIPDEINMEIDGIPALRVYTPFSGMAWSQEDIYFIKDDKLFKISMLDVDNEDNRALYDKILSSFKLN